MIRGCPALLGLYKHLSQHLIWDLYGWMKRQCGSNASAKLMLALQHTRVSAFLPHSRLFLGNSSMFIQLSRETAPLVHPNNLHSLYFFYILFVSRCQETGNLYGSTKSKKLSTLFTSCQFLYLKTASSCMCSWWEATECRIKESHVDGFPSATDIVSECVARAVVWREYNIHVSLVGAFNLPLSSSKWKGNHLTCTDTQVLHSAGLLLVLVLLGSAWLMGNQSEARPVLACQFNSSRIPCFDRPIILLRLRVGHASSYYNIYGLVKSGCQVCNGSKEKRAQSNHGMVLTSFPEVWFT